MPWPRSSSTPVQMVNVSGSNIRSDAGKPVLVHREIVEPVRDLILSSTDFAMPSSSIVSAITAAPNFFASVRTFSRLLLAVLEVDRVDDRLAADQLERGFHAPAARSNR